jgi:hypothetical protein
VKHLIFQAILDVFRREPFLLVHFFRHRSWLAMYTTTHVVPLGLCRSM